LPSQDGPGNTMCAPTVEVGVVSIGTAAAMCATGLSERLVLLNSRQKAAKDAKAIPLDVALSAGLSTRSWFAAEVVARRTVLRC
jgi:hypothetical protein